MKNAEFEKKIRAACEAQGIDVDFDCGTAIDIWTPKGKEFNASGCHTCVSSYDEMSGTNYTQALRQIWNDIKAGMTTCGFLDSGEHCDHCTEEVT